jgi:hypothetical protein
MDLRKAIRFAIMAAVGALALTAAGCAESDAARRAALRSNAVSTQEEQAQKPIKLRYYGPRYTNHP